MPPQVAAPVSPDLEKNRKKAGGVAAARIHPWGSGVVRQFS
jgi:hypothetical protein